MEIDSGTVLEMFRASPAIVALLIVIWLQYRRSNSKDELIKEILSISGEDNKRQAKLMTLLEILVQRGNQ